MQFSSSTFTRLSVALLFAIASLLIVSQPAEAVTPGLPWGAAPQLAHKLVHGRSHFKWYMNWGNTRPVQTLSQIQWVPTFWAQSKIGNWHSVERYFKSRGKRPKYILGQNEPDVPTQANTSPRAAAHQWMKELRPWQRRGSKVGSPQLCWDTAKWLDPFLRELRNLGGKPDFCAAHYYGPADQGLKRFKAYVRRVRSTCRKYGIKKVWLTEIGIMASSHPSQGQVNHFAQSAFRWLDTQPYVKRAAWIGVFKVGQPYDGFMSAKNAYFNNDGSVRSLGRLMSFGNILGRALGLERRSVHSAMAERMTEADATLADLHAPLDDPRGQFEEIDENDHDHDDDAYWDALFAKEDSEDPDVDGEENDSADDDDDLFEDGFLHDLPEGGDEEEKEA